MVVGPPRLVITPAAAEFVVTWSALPGRRYRVEARAGLEGPWTNAGPDITATGATAAFTNAPPPAQKFYRLLVLP